MMMMMTEPCAAQSVDPEKICTNLNTAEGWGRRKARAVAFASVKHEYTSKKKHEPSTKPRTPWVPGMPGRTVNDIPTTGCMALVFAAASSGRGVDVGLQLQVVQKTGIDSLVRSSLGQPNIVFGRPVASTQAELQHQLESENQRLIESENSIAPIGRIALEREEEEMKGIEVLREKRKWLEESIADLSAVNPTTAARPYRAGKTDMHFSGSIDRKGLLLELRVVQLEEFRGCGRQ
uniref:Uncharacterized protein n=1 Tax=Anopheles merus TaxID=30066 RepID=A0A182VGH5_ANOME